MALNKFPLNFLVSPTDNLLSEGIARVENALGKWRIQDTPAQRTPGLTDTEPEARQVSGRLVGAVGAALHEAEPELPGLFGPEDRWKAVRSHVVAMMGADFAGWDNLSEQGVEIHFKKIRPLDYTFVMGGDGRFIGRVEVHFVHEWSLEGWPEPMRTGQWLPGRVSGYVDDSGHVHVEHAELTRIEV